jgi:hypothetical protein
LGVVEQKLVSSVVYEEGGGRQGYEIQKVYNEEAVGTANYRSLLCGVAITCSTRRK